MELEKLLKDLGEKRSAAVAKITNAATNEELDAIDLEIRKYDMQIADIQKQIALGREAGDQGDPAQRSEGGDTPEQRMFNPVASFRKQQTEEADGDIYGSLEYRNAFKNFVVNGTPIPEKYKNAENRSAEMTVVGDVAAVIPTTISNQVIEDLTTGGKIVARVTQTSFQGGIQIPISEIDPEATWLDSEEVVSEEQKAKMEAKLTFSYHLLEARIAIGILAATVSLPVFEATMVKKLKLAMFKALDKAIISGTGSGQPLGITKYTLPDEQKVEFTEKQIETVKGWARAEAALPEEYEDGEIYMMSKQTWEKHLNSMVDTTGQKIGLGKINEKGQRILNGREVMLTDRLPGYDAAGDGEIFAVLVNLQAYCLNSNLSMYYKKYTDESKNKIVHKALMIADGKMPIEKDSKGNLVGAKGIVYMTKKASQ